ncbi:hypothetical protein CF326_g9991 [Tilletia indica]|nr:hypothetical protein CF326_g9991 [Tilletia indica]
MTSVMVVVMPGGQNDGYIQASPLVAHRSPSVASRGREGRSSRAGLSMAGAMDEVLALRTVKRWLQPELGNVSPHPLVLSQSLQRGHQLT